jgi:hypothetical protein
LAEEMNGREDEGERERGRGWERGGKEREERRDRASILPRNEKGIQLNDPQRNRRSGIAKRPSEIGIMSEGNDQRIKTPVERLSETRTESHEGEMGWHMVAYGLVE